MKSATESTTFEKRWPETEHGEDACFIVTHGEGQSGARSLSAGNGRFETLPFSAVPRDLGFHINVRK